MSKSSYIPKNLKYCDKEKATGNRWICLSLLLLLIASEVNGQYFNKRIDFMGFGNAEVGFSIEKMDNGNYLIFHGANPEMNNNLGLGRTILDVNGEIVEQLATFDDNGPLYTGDVNTSTKCIDGGFITSGSRDWFQSELGDLATLCRFNENGELDWIKYLGDSLNTFLGRGATFRANGGYAFTGTYSLADDSNSYGFLAITDSLGNVEHFQSYGGNEPDAFRSIYTTSDGGFVLGGYSWSFGSLNIFDPFIVKTDSLGNQEWMRVMGTPDDDCPAKVIQTSDGNYVLCGCMNDYLNFPEESITFLYMAKLDIEGDTIWEYQYGDESGEYANLATVKETSNGDLITIGFRNNGEDAVLLRTDSDGNEMWLRSITFPDIQFGYQVAHDVIEEEDGGFVGTGYVVANFLDSLPGQDLWVFRTDSMGCLVPGCHLVDNVEVHEEEVLVSMFPNPVDDLLSVHLKSGPMPRGAQLELYDMHGRQHSTTTVNPGATTYILQMGHLPAGMYVLRCVTGGDVVWSGKVLKE